MNNIAFTYTFKHDILELILKHFFSTADPKIS